MACKEKKSAVLPTELSDRLESVQENIHILTKQIKQGNCAPNTRNTLSSPSEVVARLNQCAGGVSQSCTKLAVLFSRPPAPALEECGVLCGGVEQATLQLASALYQLQPSHGKTLKRELENAVLCVLKDAASFTAAIRKEGCSGKGARVRGTGVVWESCDTIGKVAKDNRSAALRVFISQLRLLQDACSEVNELQSSRGLSEVEDDLADSSHSEASEADCVAREWTPRESELTAPCIKLIEVSCQVTERASRLLIGRGKLEGEAEMAEVDLAVEQVRLLSPLVDELASELPAPITVSKCCKLACDLADSLSNYVECLSSCHFSEDSDWLELSQNVKLAKHAIPSLTVTT